MFGGVDYEKQRRTLEEGVDVLIGTPGRIIDYFKQHVFDLRAIQVAVLDEADRMFDLGFIKDIRFILRRLPHPTERLNMMFSATLSYRVLELAYEHMNNPELIRIEPDKMTVDRVRQVLYFPSTEEKIPLLMGLLRRIDAHRTMVFVNTRRSAEVLERTLTANGFVAQALSGDVPQTKRLKMMRDFHNGDVAVLIATDVASRGLHIPDVSHVFNFDLPNDAEDYVHRIGRTARAGAEGDAICFGCEEYAISLPDIESYIGHQIPRAAIEPADLAAVTAPPPAPWRERAPRPGQGRGGVRAAAAGRQASGRRRAPGGGSSAPAAARTAARARRLRPRMAARLATRADTGGSPAAGAPAAAGIVRCAGGGAAGAGGGAIAAASRAAARPRSHELAHPVDRRIVPGILRGTSRVRQPHRAQPPDAEIARRVEHRQAVVDEQGALGPEWLARMQARPEFRMLLRRAEGMGRVARIEILGERHLLVLDGERLGMRVGDQHAALAALLEPRQETPARRADSPPAARAARFMRGDVEPELAAPILDAIPLHGAAQRAEFRVEIGAHFVLAHAASLGEAARNVLLPEPIVEPEVEQRAVHVEQHRIDACSSRARDMRHLRMIPIDARSFGTGRRLVPIVARAGGGIMRVYRGAFAVQRKEDDSPLTLADLDSQRIIIEGLATLTPGIRFCRRNRRRRPGASGAAWRELWVVDPLDGTREFVKRNGRVHGQYRAGRRA